MIPLDDVKQWLKITASESDTQIQLLIDRATEIIERETLWYFRRMRAVDEVFDGTGTATLVMRQPPLDPDAVVVYSRAGVGGTWVVETDYEISGRKLLVASVWTRGHQNYRAVYTEGFIDPPGDVAQLLLELVSYKWKSNTENPAMQSETIGDYAYTRADVMKQTSWPSVYKNWRRLRIG